jgi:uncharacterized phiE125 gp8 family phage protein
MDLLHVSGPEGLPLTLASVRNRIGAGDGESDEALTALITAAVAKIDGPNGELGRAIQPQIWEMVLDEWPCGAIVVPLPPLQEVVSISYVATTGALVGIDPEAYVVRPGVPSRIVPAFGKSWPSLRRIAGAVTVKFKAGYAADKIPEAILTAIVLEVAHMRALTERNLFLMRERVEGVGQLDYAVTDAAMTGLTDAAQGLLKGFKVYL